MLMKQKTQINIPGFQSHVSSKKRIGKTNFDFSKMMSEKGKTGLGVYVVLTNACETFR